MAFAPLLASTLFALFAAAQVEQPPKAQPEPPPKAPEQPLAVQPAPPPLGPSLLATIGDQAVVALAAPGFAQLSREQRLLAFWLSQAAAAGDAIAWDQSWRHNLEIVHLLRGILAHPQAVSREVLAKVQAHARVLYLNHGSHDQSTERKLLPAFTASELRLASLAAQAAGADFGLGRGVRLETALRALEGPLFDPKIDPVRTNKAPPKGEDPLLASAVNFYSGVSLKDLNNFKERYPLNARLVKESGKLHEQVWRAGAPAAGHRQPAVPAGLYAERLAKVIAALEQAHKLASGTQAASIHELVGYLRTGEPDAFRASQREWLKEASAVDYILGFVESYADPRGQKGLFEGFVGFEDPARGEALRKLAQSAGYFEEEKPWAPEYKREKIAVPAASALVPLAGSGDNRPLSFDGVNLPNEQAERDKYGSKSFLIPSIDEASATIRGDRLLREFAPPELAEELVRCQASLHFALVAFHEVVGHASGKVSARLIADNKDPADLLGENYNTLEEARADLVAHWHAADPKTRELGLIPDARCQELYPHYATFDISMFVSNIPTGDKVEEDHQRASALMRWWLLDKGAVADRKVSNKHYLVVTDPARWRASAGELLALLQDIKAQGDAARLKTLVDGHATRLDPSWRDEVVSRIKALGLPRRVEMLAPRLRPVLGEKREVLDVSAEPVSDLDAQILEDWASF